ncbi:DUF4214 domain-containing protein [Massilia sp. W12]|uniref:DUF4214 domain-containing protein n=1 Tax=Massilia sp. W12 TaxID=3126507 RepID=UPI0030D59FD5
MSVITQEILSHVNGDTTSMSPDGRYLAIFRYIQSSLLTGDPPYQLLLKDLQTGDTRKLAEGNYYTNFLKFSPDSSKLLFSYVTHSNTEQSVSSDLMMYDIKQGSSKLIWQEKNASPTLQMPVVSQDGRYLSLNLKTDGWAPNDQNGKMDVYIKDTLSGAMTLVSQTSAGVAGDEDSYEEQLSVDGNIIVFSSYASNLLPPSQNKPISQARLVAKNLKSGDMQYLDIDANGKIYTHIERVVMTADGSKVFFQSSYTGSNRYYPLIMEKDLISGELKEVLRGSDSEFSYVKLHYISADGRHLLYSDGPEQDVAYIRDMQSGATRQITPYSADASSYLRFSGFSSDGKQVLLKTSSYAEFWASLAKPYQHGPWPEYLHVLSLDGGLNLDGANTLSDMMQAATLAGGAGNDHYWLEAAGSIVQEDPAAGTDSVYTSLSDYTLPGNVENLIMLLKGNPAGQGLAERNLHIGRGNALNNQITGSSQDDHLYGADGDDIMHVRIDDMLYLNSGNDFVDGGNGFDIIKAGRLFDGKVSFANGRFNAATGHGSTLSFVNVERVEGDKKGFFLPGDTHAEQAFRIYQAAFNRAPDAGGLGYWISRFDQGVSVEQVAQGFMQSAEFKSMYGDAPGNAAMVDQFYQNVLHRAPDAGGRAFWLDILDQQKGTPASVLAAFAESAENQAALVGVIQAGVPYEVFQA